MKSKFSRRTVTKALAAAAVAPALTRCGGTPAEKADVLVIGAGIAGLYAAWLLQQQGLSPLVIEGSERIGGRLRTLDHLKGTPEAGGQTLDSMYARTLATLAELGIGTFPRKSYAPGFALAVNGELLDSKGWADSPANKLVGDERAVLPQQLADFFLDRTQPLKSLDGWMRPEARDFDSRSFAAELQRVGASAEAQRLTEILYDGRGLANISALFAYRKRLVAKSGGGQFFRIHGGSARLPEALAKRLKREVQQDRAVTRIDVSDAGVEVRCTSGARYQARFALCSIPWSVLRGLVLKPEPPQWALIGALPYNDITEVKLGFREPFWEADGLPAAMMSDLPFEKVLAVPAEDGSLNELNCWIDGEGAAELDRRAPGKIGEAVVADISKVRPAAAGKLEVLDVTSWGQNPFARGSYHFWGPGQITHYGEVARQPWGPLHWIGEHTAVLQQGIEGAMESAEREVLALLQRMGGRGP
jgi:monoamine oxidase